MEHIKAKDAVETLRNVIEKSDKPVLMLIQGLPGAGKSTLGRRIANDYHYHFEADEFFIDGQGAYNFNKNLLSYAHKWCLGQTAYTLNFKYSVIVTNTFTSDRELAPYIELSKHVDAKLIIVLLNTQYDSIHNVPEDVMERMRKRMSTELKTSPDYIIV